MSIRMVVTAGFGNGTFNGTIKDVTLRGYSIGEALLVIGNPDNIAFVLFRDKRVFIQFRDKRVII